jgi:hypothetical protein
MRKMRKARRLEQFRFVSVALACATILAAGLLGCEKGTEPAPEPTPTPEATPTPAAEATPTPAPEGSVEAPAATVDAVVLIEDQCTKCHGIPRVKEHRGEFDLAKWDETVTRMMGKNGGPVLTAEQKKAVVEFLATDKPLPEV